MKKIKTKTQNGTGVVFSIQHEEIRCEINHPKMGKMITYGQKYGEKNGISGLFTYSLSAGNAFLTVEKKEIQPLLNELKNNKDRKDVK